MQLIRIRQSAIVCRKFPAKMARMQTKMKALRKSRHVTLERLSEAVGISVSQLSRFETGEREPRVSEMQRIAKFLHVDMGEVTAGAARGSRDTDEKAISSVGIRRNIKTGTIPEFDLRAGASYGGGYALPTDVVDGDGRTYSAEMVKAEWGIPTSYIEGELRLKASMTDIIAIDGPSMVPDLYPGDRVMIDRSHRDPRQGGIFAVREGEGVIVKHVEVVRGSDPPRIICKSSNPMYAPFELVMDGEQSEIIGRAAGRISRM